MATGKRWTRDELLIALNLYHKLTFGQLDSRQPAIIALAAKMGRGANSLAMKLNNLASLDPVLKMRGIKGLSGASRLDRAMWEEFHEDLNESAPRSEQAFRALFNLGDTDEIEITRQEGVRILKVPKGSTDSHATIKVRRGQEYFRQAVINNFDGCCGVTGLGLRELLIASHILPWAKHESERLNVRNGLCLSRLHDAAFDRGLITFDANLRLRLSKRLKSFLPQRTVTECFAMYEGEPLKLPKEAVIPDLQFLAVHSSKIFLKDR